MNYNVIHLGQSIIRYPVPLEIFISINQIYEKNLYNLKKANKLLIGKIKNEHSLFNDSEKQDMEKHNILPSIILKFFMEKFEHYLKVCKVGPANAKLSSIWINEMKEHEYNPIHIHRGDVFTGLSSVMILKLPSTFGNEYSSKKVPQNGKLQILGSASGQFAKIDYQPPMHVGDFYIFPYDMRHVVYPFNGTNETRRTLAANCDVKYNPIICRGRALEYKI